MKKTWLKDKPSVGFSISRILFSEHNLWDKSISPIVDFRTGNDVSACGGLGVECTLEIVNGKFKWIPKKKKDCFRFTNIKADAATKITRTVGNNLRRIGSKVPLDESEISTKIEMMRDWEHLSKSAFWTKYGIK